ncbi:hypothetical protein A2U01_0104408, partial [Trifolium medium]|nr:hypothetical protein [Trifolium medium]
MGTRDRRQEKGHGGGDQGTPLRVRGWCSLGGERTTTPWSNILTEINGGEGGGR